MLRPLSQLLSLRLSRKLVAEVEEAEAEAQVAQGA